MRKASTSLRVLMVDSVYRQGGAAAVAHNLALGLRARGHECTQVVGWGDALPDGVLRMPQPAPEPARTLHVAAAILDRVSRRAGDLPRGIAQRLLSPAAPVDGSENFEFPGTKRLLQAAGTVPDVVHCHNLHGGYFDLRYLPKLSHAVPTFLTMHDAWLLSGHCAHSFACERWRTGCGNCPDLTIPPAIPHDRTAENWRLKADIYRRSRLFVATPSRWLMRKLSESMVVPGIAQSRVIPNGVDLEVFSARQERMAARRALSLEPYAFVLVFAANGIRENVWKDMATLRRALGIAAERLPGKTRLLALGESAPSERFGTATVEFVPHVDDRSTMARYYRAADAYVHAARADTFPNTVLEALSCGTPVIATAVGGIPEQVKSLGLPFVDPETLRHDASEATGLLTPAGDADSLAEAIVYLGTQASLTARLGENARRDAQFRFDVQKQLTEYIDWYHAALSGRNGSP